MAIDTAAKRHSAINWGLPWRTMPLPDGTIDQGDRQHVALMYSGILASEMQADPIVEQGIYARVLFPDTAYNRLGETESGYGRPAPPESGYARP